MPEKYLENCLYFTVNKLSRVISKMAEESFRPTGITPTHGFMMMLVNNKPGISQSELAEELHMTPSTITRFVDKLVVKGLAERKVQGKMSHIHPTQAGIEIQTDLEKAWKDLYRTYSDLLGEEEGKALTKATHLAAGQLES